MSENKKIENAIPEVKDDELDAVTGGVKRTAGQPRSNYCSTCSKNVTPDDDGCCPNCGKRL